MGVPTVTSLYGPMEAKSGVPTELFFILGDQNYFAHAQKVLLLPHSPPVMSDEDGVIDVHLHILQMMWLMVIT